MKITDVKLIEAHVWRWVRVSTDEGLSGIGDLHGGSGGSGAPCTVAAAVRYMAEYLIGKDPLHIEKHWQHMFRRLLFRGGTFPVLSGSSLPVCISGASPCGRSA